MDRPPASTTEMFGLWFADTLTEKPPIGVILVAISSFWQWSWITKQRIDFTKNMYELLLT